MNMSVILQSTAAMPPPERPILSIIIILIVSVVFCFLAGKGFQRKGYPFWSGAISALCITAVIIFLSQCSTMSGDAKKAAKLYVKCTYKNDENACKKGHRIVYKYKEKADEFEVLVAKEVKSLGYRYDE